MLRPFGQRLVSCNLALVNMKVAMCLMEILKYLINEVFEFNISLITYMYFDDY